MSKNQYLLSPNIDGSKPLIASLSMCTTGGVILQLDDGDEILEIVTLNTDGSMYRHTIKEEEVKRFGIKINEDEEILLDSEDDF